LYQEVLLRNKADEPWLFFPISEQLFHFLVNSAPTISRLAVSTTTRWHLQSLSDSVKKINLRLMPQFDADVAGGVNTEEFDEARETLLELYDIYNE